jgi:PQQ-dependent catabolism-associated CXXCW motif protein
MICAGARFAKENEGMMKRCLKWAARACGALALALAVSGAGAQGHADEDRDWGLAPTSQLRKPPYSAPTPLRIPGATTIGTAALDALMASDGKPVLVDVASGEGHATLPGAFWIPGAGHGFSFIDGVQASLVELLEKITGGDKKKSLVFFCVNAQCWLSYNASLRATAAGYAAVYWYRGGIEAWRSAGFPLVKMEPSALEAP